MPGMMDTVLNLGLNDASGVGLARTSRDERFAYDSYRRFLQMYGQVVLGIEYDHFEAPAHFIKPLARLSAREIYVSPTFRNPGRIDMELILTFTRNSANG
jgi:phosphoenolpyruvate synthase/pyruvate phosphate dikinase